MSRFFLGETRRAVYRSDILVEFGEDCRSVGVATVEDLSPTKEKINHRVGNCFRGVVGGCG